MKFTALILAITLLVLSCLPCQDSVPAVKDMKSGVELTHNHSHQDQDHTDGCSPFCVCACCSVIYINHSLAVANTFVLQYQLEHMHLYTRRIKEISLPVWQPPQLSA